MNLLQFASQKVETLSKGMSQKVQFIAAVVPEPKLLILDEPFSGLDPVSADTIRASILEMRRRGSTVILSTHDMNVAENFCDNIFMIYRGKKVLDGTLDSIQSHYGSDTIRVEVEGGVRSISCRVSKAFETSARFRSCAWRRAAIPRTFCAHCSRAQASAHSQSSARPCTTFSCVSPPLPTCPKVMPRQRRPPVRRVLLVAKRDYRETVKNKGFLVGMILFPVLFGGAFPLIALLNNPATKEQHVAILDHTGVAAPAVIAAAEQQNTKDMFDKTTGR